MRRELPVRFAIIYLCGQAVAVPVWWVGLYAVPTFRNLFLGGGLTWEALQSLLVPDLVFLTVLGALSAHRLGKANREVPMVLVAHVGAGAYAALLAAGYSVFSGVPPLGAILMAPYLLVGPLLLRRTRR